MYVAGILNIHLGFHNSYLSSGRAEPGHLPTVPSQPSQAEQTKTTIEHTDLRLHELLAALRHFLACFADSRNCSLIAFLCCFRALISTHSTCGRSRRKEGHEEKVDFFTRCIICTSFIQCRENINWKACQLVLVHRACPKCIQSEAPVPDPQNHSCFSLVHLGLPSLCPVSDGRVHYC